MKPTVEVLALGFSVTFNSQPLTGGSHHMRLCLIRFRRPELDSIGQLAPDERKRITRFIAVVDRHPTTSKAQDLQRRFVW